MNASTMTTITVPADMAPILIAVMESLAKAERKHGPINSALEGWAVIREEAHELNEAIEGPMWAAARADSFSAVMHEAEHVAAMALRFLKDVRTCQGTTWRQPEQGATPERRSAPRVETDGAGFDAGRDLKAHIHIDGQKVAEAAMRSFDNSAQQIEALRATIREQDRTIEEAKRANDMMREERDAAQATVRKCYSEIEIVAKERDEAQRTLRTERRTTQLIHDLTSGDVTAVMVDSLGPFNPFGPGAPEKIASAVAEAMKRAGVRSR